MNLDVVTVGDSVVDIVIPVQRFPTGNEETVQGTGMYRHLGGSSNFLIMASRLGLKAGVFDLVGDDELGKYYLENLLAEGVDASGIKVKENVQTSSCICMVDPRGQHAYISFPGATISLTSEHIDTKTIQNAKTLYISGYSLIENPIRETTLETIKIAAKSKIPVFFDPSPNIDKIPDENTKTVLKHVNTLLLNERELKLLTKQASTEDAVKSLLSQGVETIILKQGQEGCAVYRESETHNSPGLQVDAVDTTGAGDVFNAAYLYGYLKNWSLKQTTSFANTCASIKVTKLGAGRNVPTISEIREAYPLFNREH